ncbi:MAG: NAD-dependent epimerase/dehydratase family protein [Anaerocolumna sp.]
MKKVLIVGEGSFIGGGIQAWLQQYPKEYSITTITSKLNLWSKVDFSRYDVVINVAGIAHIKVKPHMEKLFYKVNRDLAINLAKKAKDSGVNQYIYMSSMNVFGDANDEINKNTNPSPQNFYGDSKLQADILLQEYNDDNFGVVSIRPPIVYGKGAKGNIALLERIAKKTIIFPDYKNTKSMIYIDNLCEFIKLIIDYGDRGIFHPQNKEYISTSELVKLYSKGIRKKIAFVKWFNPLIILLVKKNSIFHKAFGNDFYAKELSAYRDDRYCIYSTKESINIMYKNCQ